MDADGRKTTPVRSSTMERCVPNPYGSVIAKPQGWSLSEGTINSGEPELVISFMDHQEKKDNAVGSHQEDQNEK
jgi:hypothetical protein